jgi:hypothetical protein
VENYQPVNELFQTADHPALSPDFCHPEQRVILATQFGGSGLNNVENLRKILAI